MFFGHGLLKLNNCNGHALGSVDLRVPSIPLDGFPTPAAAFSTRRLLSSYTGPAMRVRRGSDWAEVDVGFDAAGDLDTATMLAHVGANDGFVVTWYDQSGNERNVTQITAANQPRVVNAGIVETMGGKPTIKQTSSLTILVGPHATITGVTAATVVCTFAQESSRAAPFRISSTTNNPHAPMTGGTCYETFMGPVQTQYDFFGSATSPTVYTARHTGTAREVFKNGSQVGGSVTTPIANPTNFTIPTNATPISPLTISELVLMLSALSTADRTAIETNQITYFGSTP